MCLTARGRQNGITMMINKENLTLGKDLEDCFDVVVEGTSDDVAQMAGLKDWDDDSEDVIEESTASDIEKAKARHKPLNVAVETPEKNERSSIVSYGIMTPPISIDEEIEVDTTVVEHPTPTKKVKNAASIGRSISDVLGQGNKENRQNKSKSKAMLKKAVKSTAKKSQSTKQAGTSAASSSTSQSKITGRISKSSQLVSTHVKSTTPKKQSSIEPSKPLDPIRPQAHRNNAPMFPNLSRHQSTDSISERSEGGGAVSGKNRTDRDTISPSGSVPRDMIRLLN